MEDVGFEDWLVFWGVKMGLGDFILGGENVIN